MYSLGKWPVNAPPAKAGGFGLRLKAGLIGHAADPHLNSVLFLNYSAQLAFFPQPLNPSNQPNSVSTHLIVSGASITSKQARQSNGVFTVISTPGAEFIEDGDLGLFAGPAITGPYSLEIGLAFIFAHSTVLKFELPVI